MKQGVEMKAASLILGILAIVGALVAFIPLLGWMNWGVIPFSVAGVVVSAIATAASKEDRGLAIAGIILCGIALMISIPRLIIGCGVV